MNDERQTPRPAAPPASNLDTPTPSPAAQRQIRLTTFPSQPCSYLPGKTATLRGFFAPQLDPSAYHAFMDAGFRRSGRVIYQPTCSACRLCVPIRVLVDRFTPGKSQRRCARRNADLSIAVGRPEMNDEKLDLYQRYQQHWHQKQFEPDDDSRQSLDSFLYQSPVDTLEFCYRTGDGKLVAVGIADVCPQSFSSVYFYFDPSHRERGLGTFGAVCELAWARERNIPYYYLGYWVAGCSAMSYKSRFRPFELLAEDGSWQAPPTS